MSPDSTTDELLSEDFFGELQALKRRFSWLTAARDAGVLPARQHGDSAEFFEHRPYLPGDDVRHVDWLASARSGLPIIKRYRAEKSASLRLLIDPSRSMDVGSPSKWRVAQRLVAALAYLSLGLGHRCQLLTLSESRIQARPPIRSSHHLAQLVRDLLVCPRVAHTDLDGWLRELARDALPAGTLVLVSDFLVRPTPLDAFNLLRQRGHQMVFVQLLDSSDTDPNLGELPLTLKDSEDGALLDLEPTEALLDAYRAALIGTIDPLRTWARQHRAVHVVLSTAHALATQIHAIASRTSPIGTSRARSYVVSPSSAR